MPVAVASALAPGSWLDRILSGWSALALGVPTFWLGILLILLFAVELRWLPSASGYVPFWESPGADAAQHAAARADARSLRLRHLRALPARLARRRAAKPTMSAPRAPRACASAPSSARHVMRNALLPFVTIVGMMLAGFVGGAVVTEAVFTYPGLGRLLIQAIGTRDYPLIQGCILVILVALFSSTSRRRALRLYRPTDRVCLMGGPSTTISPSRAAPRLVRPHGPRRTRDRSLARPRLGDGPGARGGGRDVVLNGRDAATLEPRRDALRDAGFRRTSRRSTSPTPTRFRRRRSQSRRATAASTFSSAMPPRPCASRCWNRPTRIGERHRGGPDRRLAPRARGGAADGAGRLRPHGLHVVDHGVGRPTLA